MVILEYLLVDRIGLLSDGSFSVVDHFVVLLLLLVELYLNAILLLFLDIVFFNQDLERLLLSAFVEEHVARGAIAVAHDAVASLVTLALLCQVLELECTDT